MCKQIEIAESTYSTYKYTHHFDNTIECLKDMQNKRTDGYLYNEKLYKFVELWKDGLSFSSYQIKKLKKVENSIVVYPSLSRFDFTDSIDTRLFFKK